MKTTYKKKMLIIYASGCVMSLIGGFVYIYFKTTNLELMLSPVFIMAIEMALIEAK